MRDAKSAGVMVRPIENAARGQANVRAWIPRSGDGPYVTIPEIAGVSMGVLGDAGLLSIAGLRAEADALASEYVDRAVALGRRAKADRLALATNAIDLNGHALIRPYRLRLRVTVRDRFLRISWRGVVKTRKGWRRYEAKNWQCESVLDKLLESASPVEVSLVQELEKEAAEIRRRWFALVRLIHYANAVVDHQLGDIQAAGHTKRSRLRQRGAGLFASLRRYLS